MLNEDKISLKCEIEYIAKKDNVDIILNGKPINFDLISKYMYYQFSALKTEFEDKYKYIIEENEKLKENCLKLEKEIENIIEDNKVIKSAYHLIKEENQKIIKENNEMKNKIQKLEKNIYEEKN